MQTQLRKTVHAAQHTLYDLSTLLTIVLYIMMALGISSQAPKYLDTLQFYVKLYVALFLLFRFNPFRHVRFTSLDAKVAFGAGLFLIATIAVDFASKTAVQLGEVASLFM